MAMDIYKFSSISKNLMVMRMMNSLLLLLLLLLLMAAASTVSEAARAGVSLSHHPRHDDASAASSVPGEPSAPGRRRRRGLASDSMGSISISISYDGGETRVQNGQMLSVSETATHPPSLYISQEGGGDEHEQQSYSVAMIDRMASREPGSPLQTFVHYWIVVRSQGPQVAAMVEEVLAPYVRPAPHDSLLHPYEVLLFAATASTTSPPAAFRGSDDRYVEDFESLVQDEAPLASTRFTEQITSPL